MVGNYLASIVLHSVEASIHLSALCECVCVCVCVCLTITMKLIKSQRTERKRQVWGAHEWIRGHKRKPENI